jgi:hypothetical protein
MTRWRSNQFGLLDAEHGELLSEAKVKVTQGAVWLIPDKQGNSPLRP